MEHWWNGTESGKPKYSEKPLPHTHFLYHKFSTDWPEIDPGPQQRKAMEGSFSLSPQQSEGVLQKCQCHGKHFQIFATHTLSTTEKD